jgi:methylglutaconyl-CoA hydratase
MDFKNLKILRREQILFCWLDRGEKRNALNEAILKEMLELFLSLEERDDVRGLVLQGEGKVFSAGADLSWMSDTDNKSRQELEKEASLFYDCFEALYKLSIPSICYVHGTVHGGANGLVAACDFTLAEHGCMFSFSEVRLGLVPATVAPFILRRTGVMNARKMMLLGNLFPASDAKNYGLIDTCCTHDESEKAIEQKIEMILLNAPAAMRRTKRLLLEISQFPDAGNLKSLCVELIADTKLSDEAREGIASFFEKRDPIWRSS